MPEGRMLKRRISESKKLGFLNSDSWRLLYTWLIPWLDVENRHSADAEIIKGRIFPKLKDWTVEKVEEGLTALNNHNLIILYKKDDEFYLQFTKTLQKIKKEREAESIIPDPKICEIIPPNSGELMSNSGELYTIKVKQIKVKQIKVKAEKPGPLSKNQEIPTEEEIEIKFGEFWKGYPAEGKFAKKDSRLKFGALVKRGELSELIKGVNGYMDFLKHQKLKNNFEQRPMYAKTFLNGRWKEFVGFKFKPDL